MTRGSLPGERRGGRRPGMPNRRSVLIARILAAADQELATTWKDLVTVLSRDQKLPADTRIALAKASLPRPKCATNKLFNGSMSLGIGALLRVVSDKTATRTDRRKAAIAVAIALLPKQPKRKSEVLKDKYGFAVNPRVAREYRDKDCERRRLSSSQSRDAPVVRKKIEKLEARLAVIQASFAHCRPAGYDAPQRDNDLKRLIQLAEKETDDHLAMTPEEEEEWIHLRARIRSVS
jgi:hypothetical protein